MGCGRLALALFALGVLLGSPAIAKPQKALKTKPHSARSFEKKFKGKDYRVVQLDLAHAELKLYWKNSTGQAFGTLGELRDAIKSSGEDFLFATNAGIYGKNLEPLGLHVERGEKLHKINKSRASTGNFFLAPNGVFLLTDEKAQILETTEAAKFKGKLIEASQSGPLLVRKGKLNPQFREASDNMKTHRSGVGLDGKGRVYFVVAEGWTNFHELAAFFRDALDCPDALFMDGTISRLLVGSDTPEPEQARFVGIWAATRRE